MLALITFAVFSKLTALYVQDLRTSFESCMGQRNDILRGVHKGLAEALACEISRLVLLKAINGSSKMRYVFLHKLSQCNHFSNEMTLPG